MANSSKKSPTDATNAVETESIKSDICSWCGGPAAQFKDRFSRNEYKISGFCQKCQDKIFGG